MAQKEFDIRPQHETWKDFQRLAKWTLILCIAIVVGMAIFLTGGHPER